MEIKQSYLSFLLILLN